LNIKTELEDLEKFKFKIIVSCFFAALFLLNSEISHSQENDFVKGNFYSLDEIKVTGLKTFNEQTVVTYTGLTAGQKIRIPGEEISQVINKLWKLELFSDINFYVTKIDGEKASIEISIIELPSLSDYKIVGLKKSKSETVETDIEIKKGQKITENFIETTKNYIINKYKKEKNKKKKTKKNKKMEGQERNRSS
jgi:outer membrane protein insertion porin family